MQITVSELKTHTKKYISLAHEQDIYITEDGVCVAKITYPKSDKLAAAKALFGLLPSDIDLDKARLERLK